MRGGYDVIMKGGYVMRGGYDVMRGGYDVIMR